MEIDWHQHITSDVKILTGKPVIKGTRISVELILDKLAAGETPEQILNSHPHISLDSIQACIAYAAKNN
jgi:uncharacterized protein (DUF433 family)